VIAPQKYSSAGLSLMTTDLSGNRLEILKEGVPKLSQVALLWLWGDAHERFGICWRYWVDGEWPRADDAAVRTGDAGGIGPMSDLERLLVPGCTELPACRCGKEMHLDHTLPLPTDTHIRVYRCLTCHYEMRLTVWGIDPLDQLNTLVIADRPRSVARNGGQSRMMS